MGDLFRMLNCWENGMLMLSSQPFTSQRELGLLHHTFSGVQPSR